MAERTVDKIISSPSVSVQDEAGDFVTLHVNTDVKLSLGDGYVDTILSGTGRYVPDEYEIGSGAELEIQAGAVLEIG